MQIWGAVIVLMAAFALGPVAAQPSTPPLAPEILTELSWDGEPLTQLSVNSQNGVTSYKYADADGRTTLFLSVLTCARATCDAIAKQLGGGIDQAATAGNGNFRKYDNTEIWAEWWTAAVGQTLELFNSTMLFRTPTGMSVWIWSTQGKADFTAKHDRLVALFNRQRFEETRQAGIGMSLWGPQIKDYASGLVAAGNSSEALTALRLYLAVAPNDLEAHLQVAQLTSDAAERTGHYSVVRSEAEAPGLRTAAAQALGLNEPTLDHVLPVSPAESGLRVVVIPLPPSDIGLLADAARIYEKSFGIPVIIRRLPTKWDWGEAQRFAGKLTMQAGLIELTGGNVDFTTWTERRFREELMNALETKPALLRYFWADFLRKTSDQPRQYDASIYLGRLVLALRPFRAKDQRTMYVGITGANIYSGDTNFSFSFGHTGGDERANILSYAMMSAEGTGDAFQSRSRQAEYLAKEMVPATLKALDIPRPSDPTDPYSFSGGTDRLKQKTLKLSPPTREALDRLNSQKP